MCCGPGRPGFCREGCLGALGLAVILPVSRMGALLGLGLGKDVVLTDGAVDGLEVVSEVGPRVGV